MRPDELDYWLPEDRIAQEPAPERAAARLFVLDRAQPGARHARVRDLPTLLRPADVVVLNETRVIPARVHGRRPSGGRLELLLVRALGPGAEWEALVRGTPREGERVHLEGATGEWVAPLGDGRWRVRLDLDEPVLAWLDRVGEVPLPPYIRRAGGPAPADRERYQTVYARVPGSVAAPTAGLHLTPALLEALGAAGIAIARLTLHVGPGTFLPIRTDVLEEHVMASEPYEIPPAAAEAITTARARGGRVVAVGTTTVRALESSAVDGWLAAGGGEATLFIRPGHRFRAVDAMLTNFHLPRSTLLALVAAFVGWDRLRAAYEEAVRSGYRFYSFGDAMLVT
jgi:S-adenosylmethionine:tRNA ribosyltransferase-isomerase